MLIGMIQWLVFIGKPDLCHALTSLNRFGACLREYHLELTVHIFGYLKQVLSPLIAMDLQPLEFDRTNFLKKLIPDFLQNYPDAC